MNTSQAVALVVTIMLLLNLAYLVSAYPQGAGPSGYQTTKKLENECSKEDVSTLCQTCAAKTKSNVVYPMCCTNEEDARLFCERYINYGEDQD